MNIQINSPYYENQLNCALERRSSLLRATYGEITPEWLDQLREADSSIASIIDLVVHGQGGES